MDWNSWERIFKNKTLDDYIIPMEKSAKGDRYGKLINKEEWTEKGTEAYPAMWELEGTTRSVKTSSLGDKYSNDTADEFSEYKITLVAELPKSIQESKDQKIVLAATAALKRMQDQFENMERFRVGFAKKIFNENIYTIAVAKAFTTAAQEDKTLFNAAKKEFGKKAIEHLCKKPEIKAKAEQIFIDGFRSYYYDGGVDGKGEPDEFAGQKIRTSLDVFERDMKNPAHAIPKGCVFNEAGATIAGCVDPYAKCHPDYVWKKIDAMRTKIDDKKDPDPFHPSPIWYYQGNGELISAPLVKDAYGRDIYLWAHPHYQMLTPDSHVKYKVGYKFYDCINGNYGVKIRHVKSDTKTDNAYKVFMYSRGPFIGKRTNNPSDNSVLASEVNLFPPANDADLHQNIDLAGTNQKRKGEDFERSSDSQKKKWTPGKEFQNFRSFDL